MPGGTVTPLSKAPIAQTLASMLLAHGLNKAQAAKILGVTPDTVAAWSRTGTFKLAEKLYRSHCLSIYKHVPVITPEERWARAVAELDYILENDPTEGLFEMRNGQMDVVPPDKLTDGQRRSLSRMEMLGDAGCRYWFWDKTKAIAQLRALGAMPESYSAPAAASVDMDFQLGPQGDMGGGGDAGEGEV